jgi:hypothetical protein
MFTNFLADIYFAMQKNSFDTVREKYTANLAREGGRGREGGFIIEVI